MTETEGRPILVQANVEDLSDETLTALLVVLSSAMDRLELAAEVELSLVLSDDEHLRELNRTYRGLDKPTDVLSFPVEAQSLPLGAPSILGDIIISTAYAARNATAAGHGVREELALLAVHGLLHLLGHEDETAEGAETMHGLERKLGVRADASL